DHPLEPWDPQLLTDTVSWVERALGLESEAAAAPRTWMLPVARAWALLGSVLLLMLGLHAALGRLPAERLRSPQFRRLEAGGVGLVCFGPVLLSAARVGDGLLLSDIGVTAVLTLFWVNCLLHRHAEPTVGALPNWQQTPGRMFLPGLGMLATIVAAWLTT